MRLDRSEGKCATNYSSAAPRPRGKAAAWEAQPGRVQVARSAHQASHGQPLLLAAAQRLGPVLNLRSHSVKWQEFATWQQRMHTVPARGLSD